MNSAIEAIYENGVLRPLEPLPLAEGQRVSVLIDERAMPESPLPDWCHVYRGLDEQTIREMEEIILDRSNFMPPIP